MEAAIAILILAFGMLCLLYLTLQIKMEVRRNDAVRAREVEQLRFQLNEQRSNWIQALRKDGALIASEVLPARLATRAEVAFPLRPAVTSPANPAPVLSVTPWGSGTKAKAIEMVRRGESSTKISAALSLPKPEVEFLMKLEKAAGRVS